MNQSIYIDIKPNDISVEHLTAEDYLFLDRTPTGRCIQFF